MKQLDLDTAMKIVHKYTRKSQFTEDEIAEYSEALEYMLEYDFMCPEVWMFNLGDFYRRIGKYDLALKYFHLCLDEGSTVAYIGLAHTYRRMKEFDKAYEYYLKAKENGFKNAVGYIDDMRIEQTLWKEEEFNGIG